jgi:hypothetical protein
VKDKEIIKVYVDIVKGETTCMCMKGKKQCRKPCSKDVVTRDRYKGWESTMRRNKYGK